MININNNGPNAGILNRLVSDIPSYKRNNSYLQLKILLTLALVGVSLFLLIFQSFVTKLDGADAPECRMSYMAPAYAKVHGFDQTHTKYASKYSLYLYREQGKDANPSEDDNNENHHKNNNNHDFLTGVPVLFIPGNAGSYKQVRALAAECANLYVDQYLDNNDDDDDDDDDDDANSDEKVNPNARNLDFFTADFNEDFTAFHGRTLLDQSEYLNDAIKFILSLYRKNKNPPTSVMVVGHSMGGIVARTMVTLPNYVENSINTFITLAAPHAAAPVTFDGDIMKVYSSIDKFWRSGYISEKHATRADKQLVSLARNRLQNVSLISITGGLMDTVLPADYTSIKGLIPETNGFTVFTTGIPGVWTPIDHLAIVWCDQLRKSLARAMLEVIDVKSPQRTYNLSRRMKLFRSSFLSGFEDYAAKDYDATNGKNVQLQVRLKVDNDQISSAIPGERTLITPPLYQSSSVYKKRSRNSPKMNFFYLPEESLDTEKAKFDFTALSSLPFENIEEFGKSTKPVALLCRGATSKNANMTVVDLTTETTNKKVELDCVDVSTSAHQVPRSAKSTISASESSLGGKFSPYNVLQFNTTTLANFELVVIGESPNFYSLENSDDFVIADLVKSELSNVEVNAKFWQFFLWGVDIQLPARRPLAVDIKIPAIWSSLVAYKLKVVRAFDAIETAEAERFGPLIRQWIPGIFETKWLVGSNNEPEKLILLHGVAPFVPFENNKDAYALHLQVWSDSMSVKNLFTLRIKVDILSSLRLLVMRFRLIIGALPVSIVALVLGIQFWLYNNSGTFISFAEALLRICKPKYLVGISASLSILSILVSNPVLQRLFYLLDPIGLQSLTDNSLVSDNLSSNPFFLGLEEDMLFIFGPIFFVISFGLVCLVYFLALLIANISALVYIKLIHKVMFRKNIAKFNFATDEILKSKRRIFGTILIIGSIPIYFPYQFAYVIITLVQIIVCIRCVIKSLAFDVSNTISYEKSSYKRDLSNLKNYNISFLMLMLWILPINIPVLVVFIHNFALKWQTPFSSHHNFLAIVPIFVVIERNVSGKLPLRADTKSFKLITQFILGYFVFYAVIFGAKHAWWLHYLLNFFCTWLIFVNMDIWSHYGTFANNKNPEKSKSKSDLSYLGLSPKVY